MTIKWTHRALQSYFKVGDYILENWGERVFTDFITKVEKVLNAIKDNPNAFKSSNKFINVRKGVITKYNSIFYRVKPKKNEIEILLFWDNRRNPDKLKY